MNDNNGEAPRASQLSGLAGEALLESLRQERRQLIADFVVAVETENTEAIKELGSRVGVPLTVGEDNILADALGRYAGTIL